MAKIEMKTPLVEMDGDEMTRIIWQIIKDELICPYVGLKTEYYDPRPGAPRRDRRPGSPLTPLRATKRLGVAVKCATITPNAARVEEYGLKQMWKSPNGTIRALLDGTVFPRAHRGQGHRPRGELLEEAHHHRASRLRRRLQELRDAHRRPRQGRAGLHRRGRH